MVARFVVLAALIMVAEIGPAAAQQCKCLFDHLVSAGEQHRRHVEAERPGGLGIDDHLAPRVLSRQEWIEQHSGDKGPGEDDPTPP
jgi:hypothetical protein